MSRAVLKWNVPVDDNHHPIGPGKVVHVDSQWGRRDEIQVWTEEEISDRPVRATARAAIVVGTGHPIPEGYEHIGSVIPAGSGGHLVWHVFANNGEKQGASE